MGVTIDIVSTYEHFESLKRNWNEVYAADPESHFFLSHVWLSGLFIRRPRDWFVLAAKPDDNDEYAAFFPLRLVTKRRTSSNAFYSEIHQVDSGADYSGLLCRPELESEAVPALAAHLKKMNWQRLKLRNLRASEKRRHLMLSDFDDDMFMHESRIRAEGKDGIDLMICPYTELPPDFDGFLQNRMSANTRQKVRRHLRKVAASEEYDIRTATPQTCEEDVDTLMAFWRRRWADRKGKKIDHLVSTYRTLLHHAMENGVLHMPILLRKGAAVAAHGSFIDRTNQTLLFFVSGRDLSFTALPAGLVLHAYSIRWAIENRLRVYDFLRGNEPYKYSFGPLERRIRVETIRARTGPGTGDRLDPRSIPVVLKRLAKMHESSRWREAGAAYRQVLDTFPTHREALSAYARLLSDQGDHSGARALLEQLTKHHADDDTAWHQLGRTCLELGDFAQAEQAFRTAVALTDSPPVELHYGLARALLLQGDDEQAAMELETVLRLASGDAKAVRQQQLAQLQLEQL